MMTILNYAAAVPLLWNVCVRGTSVIERNRTNSGALQSLCVFRRTPRPFFRIRETREKSKLPTRPRAWKTLPAETFWKLSLKLEKSLENTKLEGKRIAEIRFSRQRLCSGDGLRLGHHGVGQRQKCRRSAPDQQGRAGSKSRRLAPSLRPRQPPGHRHVSRALAQPLTELRSSREVLT